MDGSLVDDDLGRDGEAPTRGWSSGMPGSAQSKGDVRRVGDGCCPGDLELVGLGGVGDVGVEGEGFVGLGTTHWLAGVRSMWSAQKKNPRFRAETAGSACGCRASASGRRAEELHRGEGVVHHDGDVEGRAAAAVALGQHVLEVRAEDANEVDVADPAA